MTISTSSNKTIVLGDGATTQFAFGFIGVAAAYIEVIFTDASGNETVLAQGAGATQYRITLNAAVEGAIWGVGGTVIYDPSGTPIAVGTTLTIFRTLPLTQAISLQNQISLATLGNGAETGLDTLEMQMQQVFENIARAIVAPIVDATPPAPLPPIAQRANQGAAFDAFGNLVAGATPASGTISTAMQAVVGAATLALGRLAFGLGSAAQENIGAGLQDDGAGDLRRNSAISQVATNQAIHAANHLVRYAATGPITFTIDRGNTLWNGFGFWVEAYVGAVTLAINAADSFKGQNSGIAITIPPGTAGFVTTDGASSATWYVEGTQVLSTPVTGGTVTGLNAATASNTTWSFSAIELVLTNAFGGAVRFVNPSITINCAVNGANGLDTGSLAASTWYYYFGIGNESGAVAGLVSLSASAPTLPAGYSFVKLLGAFVTDGSSNIFGLTQRNRVTEYTDYRVMISGPSAGGAFSTAAFFPPNAATVRGVLFINGTNTATVSVFTSAAALGAATPTAQVTCVGASLNVGVAIQMPFECIETVPGQLVYAAGGSVLSSAQLLARGWENNF